MNRQLFWRLSIQAFFLMALSLLSGCSSSSHSVPAHYSLVFRAHPQINDAAPLKVRVLLLRSDADFMSADFYSLQNNAPALLGGNLLNSDQFFLMPGQLNKTLKGQTPPRHAISGFWLNISLLMAKSGDCRCRCPSRGKAIFTKSGRAHRMN